MQWIAVALALSSAVCLALGRTPALNAKWDEAAGEIVEHHYVNLGIAAAAGRASKKGPPPVHLWNPPFCGDLDMEIRADGTWFYQGSPIGRPAMVRLFASVLKREGERFFLVTPVEKLGITVEEPCLAPLTFASHAYETFQLFMPLWVCRRWQGQVRGVEGQRLAWVKPGRLRDYPMPPADEPLIPFLTELLGEARD